MSTKDADAVINAISIAEEMASTAESEYASEKTGLAAVARASIAVAYATLLQAEKQDTLIWLLESVIRGDDSITTYERNK